LVGWYLGGPSGQWLDWIRTGENFHKEKREVSLVGWFSGALVVLTSEKRSQIENEKLIENGSNGGHVFEVLVCVWKTRKKNRWLRFNRED
jgi:hypothetical protein